MPWKLIGAAGVLLAAAIFLFVYTIRDCGECGQSGVSVAKVEKPAAGPFFFAPEGRPAAPADAFAAGNGAPVTLAAFKGRPVVVNFWATWCSPCVKELPSLARLKAARGDLVIIALNVDTKAEGPIGDFLKEVGAADLEAYTDPQKKLWRAFRLNSLPTTVVIDAEGHVVARRERDAEWDSAAAQAEIDKALGK